MAKDIKDRGGRSRVAHQALGRDEQRSHKTMVQVTEEGIVRRGQRAPKSLLDSIGIIKLDNFDAICTKEDVKASIYNAQGKASAIYHAQGKAKAILGSGRH